MRTILILLLSLSVITTTYAADHYSYSDRYVRITVQWHKDSVGVETIVLKIKPLADILLPDNDGCFDLDKVYLKKCTFRNAYCPFLNLSSFISDYRIARKDTVLTYEWKTPIYEHPKGFYFHIEYIPTTTKEYAMKKKRIIHKPLENGGMGVSIKPEDWKILNNTIVLDITTD